MEKVCVCDDLVGRQFNLPRASGLRVYFAQRLGTAFIGPLLCFLSYAVLQSGMVLSEAAQAWHKLSSEAFCHPSCMDSTLSLLPEQMRQPAAFS